MKIIILKNNLKEGLSAVERAVSETNSLPILKNILFKTKKGKAVLSATNLELAITRSVAGKINEEGGITIPFHVFYPVISNIDTDRVNLATDGQSLVITTDHYRAKIQGVSEEEFPIIPKIENNEQRIEINSSVLKNAIADVVGAAQVSDIRPEISGTLLDFSVTALKFVSTDSFRLAERVVPQSEFTTNFHKGFRAIIPLKTIQEVARVFPNDVAVEIRVDPNQISFTSPETEVISRLIDGQYPDYEQIVPKGSETEVVVEREHLLNAVRLVSSFSGKVSEVQLGVAAGGRELEVYATNQYAGENNYKIPAQIKGETFRDVSFNWRYLADGLKPIRAVKVGLFVNGDSRPTVLRPAEGSGYLYLIMPIKNA